MGKRLTAVALCAFAMVGTGSAFAGERAGNGEPTPVNDYSRGFESAEVAHDSEVKWS